MTLPSRDFDASTPESDNSPLCEFRLGGRAWHVRRELPWLKALPDLKTKSTDEEVRSYAHRLFERQIVPDEVDEFMALVRSDHSPLTALKATQILGWITETRTGRPTEPPSSSSDGRPKTRASSKDVSSSPATPRKP